MSDTFGYAEVCAKSHEFLRRACTYTPKDVTWAGDLVLTSEPVLKQSEVKDFRGGAGSVSYSHPEIDGTGCGGVESGIPSQFAVEETDIRGGAESFEYLILKNPSEEDEENWSLGILQSTSDCGAMMDGGDVVQVHDIGRRVTSLCGTIDRTGGPFEIKAHYLDNRKSYSADPDNGLLVAIRTNSPVEWEVRYSHKERSLVSGLAMSDNVTVQFMEQVTALGMDHEDIFEFGMI